MPTAPFARLRASLGGGASAVGAIVGAPGQSCQLSQDLAGGGTTFRYELRDYPEGWACPTGWATDSGGVYYFVGATPPAFNLPALPLWGKIVPVLTVNSGDPGTSGLPATQFVDRSTVLSTPDPSGNGIEDIAYGESNQWDLRRKWMGPLKRNLRRIARLLLPDYAAAPEGSVLKIVDGVPTWVEGDVVFNGDFAAMAASHGLTVQGFWRSDLGIAGTTGTGKTSWANQSGGGSAITPGTGATNGIGSVGTGLNGKASLIGNGATQNGTFTVTGSAAPGTTASHEWIIFRKLNSPGNITALYDAGSTAIYSQPSTSEMIGYAGGTQPATSGVVLNQWYRASMSRNNAANEFKVGSHAATNPSDANAAPGGTRTIFDAIAGSARGQFEILALLIVQGTKANFLAFRDEADPAAQDFWTDDIEI